MSNINVSFSGGTFPVFNSFVDNYIKEVNPSYIKVYLYILRHMNSSNAISFTKMSADTGLIKSDIISAFKYWHNQGVISYNNDPENINIKIINLDNLSSSAGAANEEDMSSASLYSEKKLFQPNESVSSAYKANDVVKAIHDDEKLAHLFSLIQQMLNKNLSSNDYKIIYSFIDYLKLPEQVIIILFEYCISINKTNMRYIEKIAYSWADSGINTVKDAENFVKQKSKQQSIQSYYKQKFKINGRDFTDTETKFLLSWVNDYNASEEAILAAFEKTVLNTGKVSFKYMDTIIKSETDTSSNKNTGNGSKFKNYPANYEISETERQRIQKMLEEFEGGEK